MSYHPLLFTFGDTIAGNGFLAGVKLSGRAVMVEEERGKWWMYGVYPGAIAEVGETPKEAYLRFRNTYKAALFDIAEQATDFEGFKNEVERFLYEVDQEEESHWTAAVQAVRSGAMTVGPPFSELPRERPEDHPPSAIVEKLDATKQFTPSDNIQDTYALPAAA